LGKKEVLIDVSTAGASGDMFLSALLSLLNDDDAILPVAASLLIYDPSLRVKVHEESSGEVHGKRLEVKQDSEVKLDSDALSEVLTSVAEELELSKDATSLSRKALNILFKAESEAHKTPLSDIHLHELGTVDTILDIVGTMYMLEKANLLGNVDFIATHVAVGSGKIKTEHGELDVPVPAVKAILDMNNIPSFSGKSKTETLTPTGAALLAVLVGSYVESYESFESEIIGIGFGSKDLKDVTNALSIMVGEFTAKPAPKKKEEAKPNTKKSEVKSKEMTIDMDQWETDEVVVIETNVDDVDGEIMGHLFDTLAEDNLAIDVIMIPAFGKKNRPCTLVKVLANESNLNAVADLLIKHLGALGIRYQNWNRIKASREMIVCKMDIDNKEYMVRVKLSRSSDGSIVNIKPEADDVIRVAKMTGMTIRELKPRIILQARAITE